MAKRRQRFKTWCAKDRDDTRKINYTCNIGGEIFQFTSEDTQPFHRLEWLREEAMIDNIDLVDNEWYVESSDKR